MLHLYLRTSDELLVVNINWKIADHQKLRFVLKIHVIVREDKKKLYESSNFSSHGEKFRRQVLLIRY